MLTVADMAGACANSAAAVVGSAAPGVGARFALPWFAVRVREKLRATAEQHLSAIGCEYFSPVTTESRQWSDRVKVVEVPLFSGYLFCRFDPLRQLAILRTPGVMDLVRSGAKPAEVDAAELAYLQQTLLQKQPVEALPHLVCGERVRVIAGPMCGVEGVLVTVKSAVKLVLAVTMMNRSVAVEIGRMQVVAVGAVQ